jgi:hypothetical protein
VSAITPWQFHMEIVADACTTIRASLECYRQTGNAEHLQIALRWRTCARRNLALAAADLDADLTAARVNARAGKALITRSVVRMHPDARRLNFNKGRQ